MNKLIICFTVIVIVSHAIYLTMQHCKYNHDNVEHLLITDNDRRQGDIDCMIACQVRCKEDNNHTTCGYNVSSCVSKECVDICINNNWRY